MGAGASRIWQKKLQENMKTKNAQAAFFVFVCDIIKNDPSLPGRGCLVKCGIWKVIWNAGDLP